MYSACPRNDIPARVLKLCKKSLAKPLQLYWQKSFNEGVVPQCYKVQQITPLHKKGNKTTASNFRPISLTSHVIKIFERVVREKLVNYLEENKIIHENQHGFRKNCSCLTQLLSHTDKILEYCSKGAEVDTIYVDYAKAFDKIDHDILLKKLKLYGIDGKYHRWITNFLVGRKQFVFVDNTPSYETAVVSGVPQGSVLGPLLFVLYVNDIVEIVNNSHIHTFADDTKISRQIVTASDKNLLQEDLDAIKRWTSLNNMKLNEDKFSLISHHTKSNVEPEEMDTFRELPFFSESTTYEASTSEVIYPSESVRDLGVIIDKQLNWKDHIYKIKQDARRMIAWIFNVFYTRDKATMLLLFNALVRSRLEYCCELWDPNTVGLINEVEKIQKNFTKKIDGQKDLDYWQRLKNLKIMSLQRRRERKVIVHAFKIKVGLVRNDVNLVFETNQRTQRVKSVLKVMPRTRGKALASFENGFSVRAGKLWKKLPLELTTITELSSFVRKLDNFLKDVPDEPPVDGYYHQNKNSLLNYATSFR